MFAKLLKHDFNHYFKLWLIGAVTACGMAVVGGMCLSCLPLLYNAQFALISLVFTLAVIVSALSIVAFYVLSMVLICMRYAKNCFTDEGYLTFTLPVKRSTVFNAKFVSGLLYNLMTIAVTLLAVFIFLFIGADKFVGMLSEGISLFLRDFSAAFGGYAFCYALLCIVILLLLQVFNISIIYFAITFAGTRVRKNKLLAGIGVYYLSGVITGIAAQLAIYAINFIVSVRNPMMSHPAMIVILLIAAVWIFGVDAALYYSQLNMLDKKLELS